ncbi:ATP phosphoribosyltransferase regulatory subunit [Thiomicrorhabdus immobilis]|uniref:ATP phosphoribosyltransferase regulatory subunit n=1 Tax=Thiomicrorhabdus immobilis TaxID=2791037 RepID=A0ABM7MCZ7_9GAMM|nr:ATP phosphoribosyltransferase regulatory subunit [Thiomicrorhabdus immobilis]BCN93234.1 ATP phosphoribosyltransferase regulatory subunit [Thiomicrorhabdus immobilis]
MQQSTWFTPEGLEDLLPPQAQKLEYYRRKLVDGFELSGFEMVLPPIAEFTDSLLTGTAGHMAVDTCRFTDQESGRMMGVRADMTPQVARIVSNRLKADSTISRLCYVGEVLKTRNNKAKGSRSPIQVGAELFGHQGVESDIEIIELMLESMQLLKLPEIKMSLGHVAIVTELMALAKFSSSQSNQLINILERKAIPEFEAFIAQMDMDESLRAKFDVLPRMCGAASEVIELAKQELGGLSAELDAAISHLNTVVESIAVTYAVPVHLDMAEMRGYQYHTGIVFACYSGSKLQPIAKGGRYDNIGSVFGLALPATGFSLDLRSALDLLQEVKLNVSETVYAPLLADKSLQEAIADLKQQGFRIVKSYDFSELQKGDKTLTNESGQWTVQTL